MVFIQFLGKLEIKEYILQQGPSGHFWQCSLLKCFMNRSLQKHLENCWVADEVHTRLKA